MLTQEQITDIRNANVECFFDLSNQVVEGFEKWVALNLQTIRAALTDTLDLAQESLSVKEPQDWLSLQDSLAAPMADKVQTYSRQAFEIALATQAEFVRIGKAQYGAYSDQMKSLVKDVEKNAPAGTEAAMTALNSAISTATTLYETLQSVSP